MRRATILSATLFTAACGSDSTGPDPIERDLWGVWSVVEVCGGIMGTCLDLDGSEHVLFDAPDSLHFVVGKDPSHSFRIELRTDDDFDGHAQDFIYAWNGEAWRLLYYMARPHPDTLSLRDNFADGYSMLLARPPR